MHRVEASHVIDPDGEVIILLQNPSPPFAEWGNPNPNFFVKDSDQVTISTINSEFDADRYHYRIQVSAKHLIMASPVFKTMLKGKWKESNTLSDNGWVEVNAEGSDLEALLILLKIFHCQHHMLPKRVSLELLAKVAVLADYYECVQVLDIFSEMWIRPLKERFPTTYSRDLLLWIWIAYAFRLPVQFRDATLIAIRRSTNEITNLGLPIPEWVIQNINKRRKKSIESIIRTLHAQLRAFKSDSQNCSIECSSIMLGALTTQMNLNSLLSPKPRAPFPGWSFEGLLRTVRAFKLSHWASTTDFSDYSRSYCNCPYSSSFRSLLAWLEKDVKGLDILSDAGSSTLQFPSIDF